MAAPPNVADAAAQASLNQFNDVAAPLTTRASRSSKRLRMARELQSVGRITEAELGEHEAFHANCALAAGPPALAAIPGLPPWFVPAMAASLVPIQGQLNNIQGQLNNIQGQLNNIEARQVNMEACQVNMVASDAQDPLRPLSNAAGIVYPNFPNTYAQLNRMNGGQMTNFLNHYALAVGGNNVAKMHRIKKFIGLRIA